MSYCMSRCIIQGSFQWEIQFCDKWNIFLIYWNIIPSFPHEGSTEQQIHLRWGWHHVYQTMCRVIIDRLKLEMSLLSQTALFVIRRRRSSMTLLFNVVILCQCSIYPVRARPFWDSTKAVALLYHQRLGSEFNSASKGKESRELLLSLPFIP